MAKILVIEDDPDSREILVERLKTYDYDVDSASDGWSGLEKIKKFKPDLIILDIMMPKLDGYATCQLLRDREEKEKASHIPVIFLTAKEMLGEIEKAFACGGDDYVIKPVTWERLLVKIKKFLP